ncbi:MAG TPA: iron dependent repressor, metal binding and dimerization domain protein [Candidatus Avimonas sp.]|nr:iron dependent repressor, metal binding and dimerization domain protein [Candidatus Avimonas sp.]HQA15883.1 iron dependent repressor, metal binding and dimerization domain protein [Candidatus Avimonas sp.]HQD37382.1 iron dependent repressor, metal binding and dimerization domain protein [Candidatus Avimonas sp.]
MEPKSDFRTMKGYQLADKPRITASMEDYLEMIYRILKTQPLVRVNDLAKKLNVRPSSVSKMAAQLNDLGLISFEKYGYIGPTEKGALFGDYLLYRHDVLMDFFCHINNSADELEQVEKIEHYIDEKTVFNINRALKQLKELKK